MNKKILALLTGALGAICLTSCGKKPLEMTTSVSSTVIAGAKQKAIDYLSIKRQSYIIGVGEEKQIEVCVLPSENTKKLVYTPEDASVISVSEAGVIKGLKKGTSKIHVSSTDGSVDQDIIAFVGGALKSDDVASATSSIIDAYNDPSYEEPTRVRLVEYVKDEYACEGVADHSTESYEELVFDKKNGYFKVEGSDLYLRTPNGNLEPSYGKWIFYVMNRFMTRAIRITNTSRNYIDFNTSEYAEKYQVIYDMLNCLFVSGQSIADDMLPDYAPKEDFTKAVASPSEFTWKQAGAQEFSYFESGSQKSKVTAEDELDYYDIPTGTETNLNYRQEYIMSGTKNVAARFDYLMTYKLDGKNWTRNFCKDIYRTEDFELEKYDGNLAEDESSGFKLVDSFYDL